MLEGTTPSDVVFGTGAAGSFAPGTLIAVDVDYAEQTGYVGSGIAAAYVSDPAAVNHDVNYVRRVTFNVGRVVEVTATAVVLAQPLLAGAPAAGASAQAVVAFVDREGGSFFQEWSALFVAEQESGGRVCFYYPRLSPNPGAAAKSFGASKTGVGSGFVREELASVAKPLFAISLRAAFLALPSIDPNDGQTVLCFRSYFPAAMAAVY